MKAYQTLIALAAAAVALSFKADACTNVIVSPGRQGYFDEIVTLTKQ